LFYQWLHRPKMLMRRKWGAMSVADPEGFSESRRTAYQGFYINLDRSSDRNEQMLQQFRAFGLARRYIRFPAVDGRITGAPASSILPGEYGCFLSHANVLKGADRNRCVHILEDDAILTPLAAPLIDRFISERVFDRFDIVFTDTFIEPHPEYIRFYKALFDKHAADGKIRVVDLSNMSFCCLASYIVAPGSIDKILDLYARELASGPNLAVDVFIRNTVSAGGLRAAVAVPFVTSVRLEGIGNSTIPGRQIDSAVQRANLLLRRSIFVNRDLDEMARILGALIKQPVTSKNFLDRLTAFLTSPGLRPY
jgi:GR25 family glycosyltransferase involved in LPS biosynthesis